MRLLIQWKVNALQPPCAGKLASCAVMSLQVAYLLVMHLPLSGGQKIKLQLVKVNWEVPARCLYVFMVSI